MGLIPGIGVNAFMGVSPGFGKYRVFVSSYAINVSSDYGATWTQPVVRNAAFGSATKAMVSDNGQYMYVQSYTAGIWRSANYGASFTQIEASGSTWYGLAMSRNGQYVYKANSTSLYKSSDWGASWGAAMTNSYGYTHLTGGIHCSGDGAVVICAFFNQSYAWLSKDYAGTWGWANLGGTFLDRFALSNDGTYIIASAWTNSVAPYLSTNKGTSFTSLYSIMNNYSYVRAALSATGQYMLVPSSSYIYRSGDYGASWTTLNKAGGWNNAVISADGQTQFLISASGAVLKSVDYGVSWAQALEHQDWQASALSLITV